MNILDSGGAPEGIRKRSFVSTVWRTVHKNPDRKTEFLKGENWRILKRVA